MQSINPIYSTMAMIALAGALTSAPALAQRGVNDIEGLEKIERIDLQALELQRYRATGESALSEDEVFSHAAKLISGTDAEIDVDKPETKGGTFVFRGLVDPSAALDIDTRSGDISFSSGLARYSENGSTPGLPPRQIAAELALGQIAELGLLPDAKEVVVAHVGGLNMSARDEGGKTADFRKLVTVHFGRTLDGLPVHGASRMVAHLAEHGRLQGLVRRWVDVKAERMSARDVLGRDAVLDAAVTAFEETSGDATSLVVDSAEVVLYDDGLGIIEPAVRVTATRRYADKRLGEQPLDFYIPALRAPTGEFPTTWSQNTPKK